MIFNPVTRTRRLVAGLLAAGIVGGGTVGALAAAQGAPAKTPHTVTAAATPSTVPKPLTRAETAAEDVIGYLEKGQPAKSRAEARVLRGLAHGAAADALRKAGVPATQIAALQQRADRTARLSLRGAPALQVSQAANSVSGLMAGFYARYQDPVPAAVLRLDYLDRQAQLDAKAGDRANLRHTVQELAATWQRLRPQLIAAGGTSVATAYDRHVSALQHGGTAVASEKQAIHGLDLVDKMEAVFLAK
ncbi:MAG: hypothetical protein HZB46_16500 [Solirubrobacterales bacterium]|nr:hypothetical protein [Solirubrobacterales bacterium]